MHVLQYIKKEKMIYIFQVFSHIRQEVYPKNVLNTLIKKKSPLN